MDSFRKNKRNFVMSLLIVEFLFAISIYWIAAIYINIENKDSQLSNANTIANTSKVIYEEQRVILQKLEPTLDKSLQNILVDLSKKIRKQDIVNTEYLLSLSKDQPVTGIWILDSKGMTKLSTDGQLTNVQELYKSRSDVEWSSQIQKLLNTDGYFWIDKFSKSNLDPYTYYKRGFIGVGEVEGIGQAILEVGISIDDIQKYDDKLLEHKVEGPTQFSNLKEIRIEYSDPSADTQGERFKDGQFFYKDYVVNKVVVQDFNNEKSLLIIKTEFPELRAQSFGVIIFASVSTLLTIVIFFLIRRTIYNKG
ncbi:hypothetical protein LIS04_89 [Listeria phage LIS04]|nr:hypothetical protein LIS04_89 [Listeria phage LIS04]